MLLFRTSKDNGNLKTIAPKKKVEVQDHMNFLAAALLQLTEQKSPFSITDENMCEAQNTIEELKQLTSLLDTSNFDGHDNLSEMEELLKSLDLRRPRLEDMLSAVLDSNSSSKPNYGKNSLSNVEDCDKSKDFAVDIVSKPSKQATTEPVTWGKGKKNNNKKKKGKGKGGRRK